MAGHAAAVFSAGSETAGSGCACGRLPRRLDLDGTRAELSLKDDADSEGGRPDGGVGRDGWRALSLWTDAPGVVLLEWQVCLQEEELWELPPRSWPPGSGANAEVLQTLLVARPGRRGGQGVELEVGPVRAFRWRLFFVGPPLRRLPEAMDEVLLDEVPHSRPPPPTEVAVACRLGAGRGGDSESDSDLGGFGASVVKLALRDGATGEEPLRVPLGSPTLAALFAAAVAAFGGLQGAGEGDLQEDAAVGADTLEAVGHAAGLTMLLDSDTAVGLFLASAAGSQLGPPLVQVRWVPRAPQPAEAAAAAATPARTSSA